jgi:hypothetical protein
VNTPTETQARSLEDLASCGPITAVFHAGTTAQGHHWKLRSATGVLLAQTARVHRGGMIAQALWKTWNVIGMHVGDDIHVELRGAQKITLARASSVNDSPAIVTVTDPAGRQAVCSVREGDAFKVFGDEDQLLLQLVVDGDGPWPVKSAAGDVVGELVAGGVGPSTAISVGQMVVDAQLALGSSAYARGQHLGIRRVMQYSFAPTAACPETPVPALLPLLCRLTY